MAHYTLRLPEDLAARFDRFAASRGGRSQALRRLLRDVVEGEGGAPEPEGGASRGASRKLTLRLGEEELNVLEEVSRSAGMRRTEWACALLRGRLLQRPQFNPTDTQVLADTRQELARICANLRELSRTAKDTDAPADKRDAWVEAIESMHGEVRGELERLRQGLQGSRSYWTAQE